MRTWNQSIGQLKSELFGHKRNEVVHDWMGIIDWGRAQNGELQKCFGDLQERVNEFDRGRSFNGMAYHSQLACDVLSYLAAELHRGVVWWQEVNCSVWPVNPGQGSFICCRTHCLWWMR